MALLALSSEPFSVTTIATSPWSTSRVVRGGGGLDQGDDGRTPAPQTPRLTNAIRNIATNPGLRRRRVSGTPSGRALISNDIRIPIAHSLNKKTRSPDGREDKRQDSGTRRVRPQRQGPAARIVTYHYPPQFHEGSTAGRPPEGQRRAGTWRTENPDVSGKMPGIPTEVGLGHSRPDCTGRGSISDRKHLSRARPCGRLCGPEPVERTGVFLPRRAASNTHTTKERHRGRVHPTSAAV